MKRLYLVLTAAFFVGLLGSGCCHFSAGPRLSAQVTRHKSLPAQGVKELRLESKNGSVVVRPSVADNIEIRFEVTARAQTQTKAGKLARETRSYAKRENGVLLIETRFPERRSSREDVSCSYLIKMPAKIALRVRTTNGSIEVEDRAASCDLISSNGSVECSGVSGALAISTSNGQITLNRIRGKLDASTSNGSICGDGLNLLGTAGSLRTSNGSIRLTGIEGSLRARTSNGKLDVEFGALGTGDTLLETSNGSVELRLPERAEVAVSASTSNGSVSSTYPFARSSVPRVGSRSTGEFSTANPKSDISITTSNASIDIRPGD